MMVTRSRVRGPPIFIPSSEHQIRSYKDEPEIPPQYDRLIKSLSSGLPNEIDFSLNVCALMSARGPCVLHLDGHSNLLTLLVAQAGVFDDEGDFLRLQFAKLQYRLERDFEHFWATAGIEDADVLKLFPIVSTKYSAADCLQFPSLRDGDHKLKSLETVRTRVIQVSNIIRNLAFESFNQSIIAATRPCIKFLIVSMASDDYELRNNALDTISEIAAHITFNSDLIPTIILRLLRSFIFSDDRFLVMRATEIVGRACLNSANEVVMSEFLDSAVLERFFELASAKDVLICVNTLEALYNMSEAGRSYCDKIAEVPHSIKLLFDFCTIEASQFFTEGLSGIKVIEYQASGQEHHTQASRHHIQYPQPPFSPQHQQRVVAPQSMPMAPPPTSRQHMVVSSKGDIAITTNKPVLAAQLARPVLHQTIAPKTPVLNGSLVKPIVPLVEPSTSAQPERLPTASSSPTSKTDESNEKEDNMAEIKSESNGVDESKKQEDPQTIPNGTGNHKPPNDQKAAEEEQTTAPIKHEMNGTTENGANSEEQQSNGVKANEKEAEERPVTNGTTKKQKGKKRPATEDSMDAEETPTKKARTPKKKLKNGHIEQKQVENVKSPSPAPTLAVEPPAQQSMVCIRVPNYMCEWDACTRYFHTPAAMIYHILHSHIDENDRESPPTTSADPPSPSLIFCQWPGCERTPRSKWSLVTHLQDHHCNDNALNVAARKRREMGDFNYVARIKQALRQEIPAANHAGYSNYAAYEAIRRHAFQHMSRDLTEDQAEGPVTKDLRLTSALILRNLAKHSAEARRRLLPYQPFIAYMAMSRLEAGVALAQCLASYSSAVSPM